MNDSFIKLPNGVFLNLSGIESIDIGKFKSNADIVQKILVIRTKSGSTFSTNTEFLDVLLNEIHVVNKDTESEE